MRVAEMDDDSKKTKQREYHHNWYLAHKAEHHAYTKAWKKANPERLSEMNKKYASANKEKIAEYHRKHREKNPEKHRKWLRDWRKNNPELSKAKYRRDRIKAKYGMTTDDWNTLFEKQDCKCAICGSPEPGGKYGWHVDHDHETDVVRGILCCHCNSMIGHAKDDTDRLRSAITYLMTGGPASRP